MDLNSYIQLVSLIKQKNARSRSKQRLPIDTIPLEILLLIFEEYCRSQYPLDDPALPELLLTHVCQHWRSAAINISTLWTRVTVSPQTTSKIVLTYLDRSGDLPLDLQIDLRHDPSNIDLHKRVICTWDIIKSTASRWRRLHIQVGPQDAISVSNNLRELDSPVLEDFRMTSISPIPGLTNMFIGGTPSLKSLCLVGVSLLQFAPPLEDLRRLHLTSNAPTSFAVFRDLLLKMTRLEDLTLQSRVVEGWPLQPSEENIITLPSLNVFKLSDQRCPLFIPLVSISAPHLLTLSLSDLVAHDLPEPFLESQLREQYPSVQNLIFEGKSSFVDAASFVQLTRIFPDVNHISLTEVDAYFLRGSCENMHETSIWPKLQTISMKPVVEEDILRGLISARTGLVRGSSLKTIIVPDSNRFKKMDWMPQQVNLEEYKDLVSLC